MEIGNKRIPCPKCGGEKSYYDHSFASDFSFVKFAWNCECGTSGEDLFGFEYIATDIDQEV